MSIDFDKYLQFIRQDTRFTSGRNLYTETEIFVSSKTGTVKGEKLQRSPDLRQILADPVFVLAELRSYALGDHHHHQHMLLVGRPGLGKSTALKQLTLMLSDEVFDESPIIPVFLQLKSRKSISEQIIAEFRRVGIRVTSQELDDLLIRGRLLLLLDGINEIPSEKQRREIQEFREENPATPMIFTTRDSTLGGDLGIKKRLEMHPLNESQIRDFVVKYLTQRQLPEYVDILLSQLSGRLKEIAKVPLLLSMFCDVFDPVTQQIPQNKGELFRLFDAEYDKFKGTTAVVSEDFHRFNTELLRHLAFFMIQGNSSRTADALFSIERGRAEKVLENSLTGRVDAPAQRAKEWLEDLLEHHLLQVATDPKEIEFRHQLFQEYYAAEELLLRFPEMAEEIFKQDYLNFLKWTESIALMLSLFQNRAESLQVVDLALNVDLRVGARLAGEVSFIFQEAAVETVSALQVSDKLKVELLGETRSEAAIPKLLSYLAHADIHIVETAASYLGETHHQEAIDSLTERLEEVGTEFFSQESWGDSDETGIFWTAHVRALSYLSPTLTTQLLKDKLADYSSLLLLITDVGKIFVELNAETTIAELLQQFQDAQAEDNRKLAAGIEESETEVDLPIDSGRALGTDGSGSGSASRTIRFTPPSSESIRRNNVLNLLENSSDYELFIPDLIQLFDTEPDESIQKQIIKILGKSRHSIAIQFLSQQIGTGNSNIRTEAAKQLSKLSAIDDFESIKTLNELINHQDLTISWCVAIILGKIGDSRVLPRMIEELENNTNPGIRSTAARIIGIIGDRSCISSLSQAVKNDSDRYVRLHAACSLSHFEEQAAIPILLESLKSGTNSDPHAEIIKSIARFGLKEALLEIIQSKKMYWQRAAIELGKLEKRQKSNGSTVLQHLFDALVDRGLETSDETIEVLSDLAEAKMVEHLIKALEEPDAHTADIYFPNRIALVLVRCHLDIISGFLPTLKELNRNSSIPQLSWLIPAILGRYKFYNYEVRQVAINSNRNEILQDQKVIGLSVLAKINQTTQDNNQHLQKMADEPRTENNNYYMEGSPGSQLNISNGSGDINNNVPQSNSAPKKSPSWGLILTAIGIVLTLLGIAISMNVSGAFNQEYRQFIQRVIPSQAE